MFSNFTYTVYLFWQDRIVSMTLDKEYDVAVEAIRLVTLILQWVTWYFHMDTQETLQYYITI